MIIFYLIDHILSEPFVFSVSVLFSNNYPKFKFTAKKNGLTYAISVIFFEFLSKKILFIFLC